MSFIVKIKFYCATSFGKIAVTMCSWQEMKLCIIITFGIITWLTSYYLYKHQKPLSNDYIHIHHVLYYPVPHNTTLICIPSKFNILFYIIIVLSFFFIHETSVRWPGRVFTETCARIYWAPFTNNFKSRGKNP